MTDDQKLRNRCADRCAESGDMPCWQVHADMMAEFEWDEKWTPCSDCENDGEEKSPPTADEIERVAAECARRVLMDKVHAEARERHINDATQSGYEHHLVIVAGEHAARLAIQAMNQRGEPVALKDND